MKPESSPDVPLEPDAALPAAAADEAVVSPDACPSVAPSKMPLAGESDARVGNAPAARTSPPIAQTSAMTESN